MFLEENHVHKYLVFCRLQKNLDEKTLKAYRIDLSQYLLYSRFCFFENEKEKLLAYLEQLHQDYKPGTVKRKVASLKAFVNYCLDDEIIDKNPFGRISVKYHTPVILPQTIPKEYVWKLLQVAHQNLNEPFKSIFQKRTILRDVSILELLFATGVRVSELCSLSIRSLNINDQHLRIMGKGDKERIVQIAHPVVLSLLRKYLSVCIEGCNQNAPLFYTRNGGAISEGSVRRIINKYVKSAGLFEHYTPHMFRHTFATLLLEEGVDIRYIQNLLGHSSIKTTQIYTHVANSKQRDIIASSHPRNKMIIHNAGLGV